MSEAVMVPAVHNWRSNAELIEAVHQLGYLRNTDRILDPTYGYGVFWQNWQPAAGNLVGCDLDPAKSPWGSSIDFTNLPFEDRWFHAVVFDPPYKLNGRPDPIEERYGVHETTRWQDRMALIAAGTTECARVCADRLLVKCQDQVCSGAVRWQTRLVLDAAEAAGFNQVERFDLIGKSRPQPMEGRKQKHAHGRGSTLLVFSRLGVREQAA